MNKKYKNGRNGRVGFRKVGAKKTLTIRISPDSHANYFKINERDGKGSATKVIECALDESVNLKR